MTGQDEIPTAQQAFTASLMLTGGHASPAPARRVAVGLDAVEEAMATGDASLMLRTWHAACLDALGSQQWEPMVAVGDAARRIGQITGFKISFTAKARQAYHVGLYRAHKQQAAEGVRRIAEAFAAIGDGEAVEQCAAIAERLRAMEAG